MVQKQFFCIYIIWFYSEGGGRYDPEETRDVKVADARLRLDQRRE